MVIEQSKPVATVAREIGVNEQTLRNWVNAYRRAHADEEPPLSLSERARLRELEREVRTFLWHSASSLSDNKRSGSAIREVQGGSQFLEAVDATIPWARWVGLIEGVYYDGKKGRKPKPLETMLRMYLLQAWFSLSDEGVEDAVYDSYAMRKFLGLDFAVEQVPDATTLLHFRHLLETHHLGEKLLASQNEVFEEQGGSCVGDPSWTPRSSLRRLRRRTPRPAGTRRCIRRRRATSGTSG